MGGGHENDDELVIIPQHDQKHPSDNNNNNNNNNRTSSGPLASEQEVERDIFLASQIPSNICYGASAIEESGVLNCKATPKILMNDQLLFVYQPSLLVKNPLKDCTFLTDKRIIRIRSGIIVQSVYWKDIAQATYKPSNAVVALFRNEKIRFRVYHSDKKQTIAIWHNDVAVWLLSVIQACIAKYPRQENQEEGKSEVVNDAQEASVSQKPPSMKRADFSRQVSERTELRNQLHMAIEDNKDIRSCRICMENEISSVFLNCGHVMACLECAKGYTNKECPVCRTRVEKVQEIFWCS